MDHDPDHSPRSGRQAYPWSRMAALVVGLLALVALVGLWRSPLLRLERLRRQVESRGGRVFVVTLQGRRQAFLLLDCRLDRLDLSGDGIRRERVLAPDFYPFAFCMGQRIMPRQGALEVELRMGALGAGGGNQGGGTYLSGDGTHWRRL